MSIETRHYDVLIVGAGNAACCAAFGALDQKASIGILEKAPKRDRGGNSALHFQVLRHEVGNSQTGTANTGDRAESADQCADR